jgi:uncharacterized protein (TIGR04222 family)
MGVAVAAAFLLRWWLRQPGGEVPPGRMPALHPFEVAYLAGGTKAVTDAAIATLVHRGTLAVDAKKRRLVASSLPPEGVTPVEVAVHRAVEEHDGKVSSVRRAVRDIARSAATRLETLGLVTGDAQARLVRFAPALVLLAVVVLGIAKIVIGMERHRAVGLLIALVVVTFLAGVIFAVLAPFRTRRGKHVLAGLKRERAALQATAARAPNSLAGDDLALAFALYGASVFAFGPMADLRQTLAPPSAGGSGCGSSSGCGGSSCGGSGGGCGGGGCGGCGGS